MTTIERGRTEKERTYIGTSPKSNESNGNTRSHVNLYFARGRDINQEQSIFQSEGGAKSIYYGEKPLVARNRFEFLITRLCDPFAGRHDGHNRVACRTYCTGTWVRAAFYSGNIVSIVSLHASV